MTVTLEPRGLNWINNINTNAFGSVVSQACWFIGSIGFTVLACYLMTRSDVWLPVGVLDEHGVRQMVLLSRETTRGLGNNLAGLLLAAWTGKTIAGVVDSNNKRKANPAYAEVIEAKERGKASGAAAALVLSETALDAKSARGNGLPTKEHPAIVVNAEDQASVKVEPLSDERPTSPTLPVPGGEERRKRSSVPVEQVWAEGDPQAGIL